MIWGQVAFLTVIFALTVYFLRNRGKSRAKAYKKIALILFLILSVITIIDPDLLNSMAYLLGIGRGADLLLYCLALVVLFQLLNNYLKDMDEQEKLNKLARKIAIVEANENNSFKTSGKK